MNQPLINTIFDAAMREFATRMGPLQDRIAEVRTSFPPEGIDHLYCSFAVKDDKLPDPNDIGTTYIEPMVVSMMRLFEGRNDLVVFNVPASVVLGARRENYRVGNIPVIGTMVYEGRHAQTLISLEMFFLKALD